MLKMFRKKTLLPLLLLLLLLAPTYVLIVHGVECSDFPEADHVGAVEYRFLGNDREQTAGPVKNVEIGSPVYRLLYAAFDGAKRVRKSKMPEEYAEYKVTFAQDTLGDEVVYLYIAKGDFSLYIRSSENKYFRLAVPTLSLGTNLLPPSAASVFLDGEEVVNNYDYPEYPGGQTAITSIRISKWENIEKFVCSCDGCERTYTMNFLSTGTSQRVTDPTLIPDANPDSVLLELKGEVASGISVALRYYIVIE